MKNFSRAGFIKTRSHGSAVESGEPIAIGSKASVAMGSYEANAEGEYLQAGVHEFKKSAGLALVQGTKYDWDATAKEIVAAAAGDFELGEADVDAQAGDEVGFILVNGLGYNFN